MSNGAVFVLVENHKNICGKVNFILSITVVQNLPATFRFWSAVAQCLYIPPPKIKSKLKTVCNSLRLTINAFFGSPLFLWFKHATRVHISNTHLKTNGKRKTISYISFCNRQHKPKRSMRRRRRQLF